MDDRIYVGIDPGLKGALAIISRGGKPLASTRMPDRAGLAKLFRLWLDVYPEAVVVIEKAQAMPKQGIASAFNYGTGYGTLIGFIAATGWPFHEIRPAVWKKQILAGEADRKHKGTSIRVCERIFPSVELTPGRCTKPHDGLAEAFLIAEFGRRNNL